jgi:hypothetical protein
MTCTFINKQADNSLIRIGRQGFDVKNQSNLNINVNFCRIEHVVAEQSSIGSLFDAELRHIGSITVAAVVGNRRTQQLEPVVELIWTLKA